MTLAPGSRLGPYQIVSALGAGGMGEVYRAHDTGLKREVAIKVLPEAFAQDPERLARFQREAELLATLNHPNIAAIYGLEDRALVLELVEGPTLAERIARGALPLEEALPIARQIADALDAAHEQGVIHRDLKPANVKVRPDGTVKVLDFGLAKALEPAPGANRKDVSQSPTITTPAMTRAGVVLGTAAYMSPEQARGQAADKRSDVWAFGCVLFEMLTGTRAFAAEGMSDTIAAVLRAEPEWTKLPSLVPQPIATLLKRCLEKDHKRRLRDIGDARLELDARGESAAPGPVAAAGRRTKRLAWIAGAIVLALVAALVSGRAGFFGSRALDTSSYHASIVLPEGVHLLPGNAPGRFALSPDGRRLVIVAADDAGRIMLWIRPLDSVAVQPLAGTEGAGFPFWSPDSRFIAFLAPGKLKKIGVSGGAPLTLTDVSFSAGSFSFGSTGAWNQDDVILFTPAGGSPLYRVSASGGTASQVTTLDTASGEAQHWFPSFLPDGRHFLYSAVGTKTGGLTDPRGVYVRSLDPAEKSTQLLTIGSNARYAQGHLIFLRGGTLMAQAFDVNRLELSGEAVPLAEEVQRGGTGLTGAAGAFSVSDTAVLAYQTASSTVRAQLAWFDRTGRQIALLGDQADYGDVALSPDGKRVAVSLLDPTRGTRDLWLYDVARGVRTPFTSDPEDEFAPAWSPGGDRLVYSARRKGSIDLYEKPSSGAGREDLLFADSLGKYQSSWSGDGRFLVYVAGGGVIGRSGLWILPHSGDRKAFPFLDTRFVQTHGRFSPDGRWIAYTSNESGSPEVYVAPFPATGVRVRVSPAGGGWPRWGRDGKELLYLTPDNTLTAASVAGDASGFAVGAVRPLFATRPRPFVRLDAYAYDVSPDGQRILINTLVEAKTSLAITLVVNWPVGLKK